MASLATGKDYHNAARRLHLYLHKSGQTLPVPISSTKITIRRMKKGGGLIDVHYPVIYFSSWMKYILLSGGQFLLAGNTVQNKAAYTDLFQRFWERYEAVNDQHPVFTQKTEAQRSFTVPIAIHGDESRGLNKDPVLIESYQPILAWTGEENLNMLGCFSCIFATQRLAPTFAPSRARSLDACCDVRCLHLAVS